jgi:hypothetical protein
MYGDKNKRVANGINAWTLEHRDRKQNLMSRQSKRSDKGTRSLSYTDMLHLVVGALRKGVKGRNEGGGEEAKRVRRETPSARGMEPATTNKSETQEAPIPSHASSS